MKKFLSFIGREIARSIIFGTFLILFIAWAVYALSYPSAPPTGEIAGGKFMQYFNSIKVACPAGQYLNGYDVNYNKICATAPTGPQGPVGANGGNGGFYNDGGSAGCGIGVCVVNPKTGWYSCPAGYAGYRTAAGGSVVSGLVLCL